MIIKIHQHRDCYDFSVYKYYENAFIFPMYFWIKNNFNYFDKYSYVLFVDVKIKNDFHYKFNLDTEKFYTVLEIKNKNPEAYNWLKENLESYKYHLAIRCTEKSDLKSYVNKTIESIIKLRF